MSFPTMAHTYGKTRTGIGDIIALTPGQSYTLDLTKNGGTAQILWIERSTTSALDDEWTALSELDATDEAGLVPPPTAKAVAVNVSVVPAGSPRLPVALTVTASASKAVHSRAHAYSGRSGGVAVGFVEDEYNALILADGADVLRPINDGVLDPLTNIGPGTDESPMTDEQLEVPAPFIVDNEPWVGAKSVESDDTRYRTLSTVYTIDKVNEWGTIELWIRPTTVAGGRNIYMIGSSRGMIQFNDSPSKITTRVSSGTTTLADPGAWVIATPYAQGDRVRMIADNSRMAECEIAGTSDGTTEPVWPTDYSTVVDNTVTWRDCGPRADFNEVNTNNRGGQGNPENLWGLGPIASDFWYHVVCIRRANSNLAMYINGQKAYEMDVQNGSGNIGTYGTPIPYQVDTVGFTVGTTRWLGDNGGEEDEMRGRFTKFAVYQFKELSDAQILAHYDKGVELGLVDSGVV